VPPWNRNGKKRDDRRQPEGGGKNAMCRGELDSKTLEAEKRGRGRAINEGTSEAAGGGKK